MTDSAQLSDARTALSRRLRFADWSALRHALLWCYDGPVPPRGHEGDFAQPDLSCWLVRKGKVTVTAAGHTVTARAGQWIFVAVPARHQSFSANAEILSMHFHFSWPGGEPVIGQKHSLVFSAADHPELERRALPLVRLVKRHFPKASAFLSDEPCSLPLYLEVQNHLPRWIAAYLEVQAAHGVYPRRLDVDDNRLLQVWAELDRLPLGRRFSEAALVKGAPLARSQLNALFTRAAGLTPRRYFEQRKLDAARRLLTTPGVSLKEIAADLGFRHGSHFSQWFKRLHGAPPSSMRG